MDKREKIIKGLEKCLERGFDCGINGNECPYYDLKSNSSGNGDCIDNLMSDTLALLKEDERAIKHQSDHLDALLKAQEPVAPKKKSFLVSGPDDYTSTPAMTVCGACDAWLLTVAPRAKYCPQCGRAVKWE